MPITIGIPFFNAEEFITDAIRSVFAQTYQDWELILANDGSTDRSLDISYAVKDPRVRVLSDGQNRRLPYRLNQITAEARFDLVGRMDADDLMSPTRFEKQAAYLSEHPECDLVTSGTFSISNDKNPVGVRYGSPESAMTGRALLLGQYGIVHAAILGRRSWFLRNPHDTSQQSGDYELWLRAFSANDFAIHVLSEPLYYYSEENNVVGWKLRREYANQRESYAKYGRLWLRRWERPLMMVISHGKGLAVRVLSALGKTSVLIARRNTKIEDKDLLDRLNRELQEIRDTKIPGIDGP